MNELLHISPISDVIGWGVFDHRICSISRPPYLNILDVHHYLNWSPAFVPERSSQIPHSSCFWSSHILSIEEPVKSVGWHNLFYPAIPARKMWRILGEIDNERKRKRRSLSLSHSLLNTRFLYLFFLQLIFLLAPSILLFRYVTYSGSQNLNTKAWRKQFLANIPTSCAVL